MDVFPKRVLWEHECYYGLGMDAFVTACSSNTNVIVVSLCMFS